MNISSQLASAVSSANTNATVRARSASASASANADPNSTVQSSEASASAAKVESAPAAAPSKASTSSDTGSATKVTISNKARAALRAAGATPNDIAKVNLSDKNAVARAIQKARMQHGKPTAKSTKTAQGDNVASQAAAHAYAATQRHSDEAKDVSDESEAGEEVEADSTDASASDTPPVR